MQAAGSMQVSEQSVHRAGPEPDAANTVGPSLQKKGRKEGKKQGNTEKKEEKNLKTSTAEIKKTHQMGNRIINYVFFLCC